MKSKKVGGKQVWIFNQFAGTPESGWGERHYYFSRYWIERGYDVKIFSGSFNHVFKKNVEVKGLYEKEVYKGVSFYWVKTPKYKATSIKRFYSMLVFMLRLCFLPTSKLGKPDVIIVSSMPIFSILSGYYFKRKFGCKLLFEIRDIWPLTLQLLGNKSANHPAVKFIGWFEKLGYRKADAVVSLLPNAKEHIEEIAKKNVTFHYIPNGIDPDAIGFEEIPIELKQSIPANKFIIGYAGTIGLANALEYFVDAAIELRNDKELFFIIVGDGYLKKTLEEKAKNCSNILFYPKIKKAQVQKLVELFDVAFVGRNDTPLFKHGVSANKYFDYMFAAKPILDSNNKIKDPVELSSGGIIVKPDDTNAIVEGILQLKNMSNEERKVMGEKGKQYVLAFHSIENLAKEYAKLF